MEYLLNKPQSDPRHTAYQKQIVFQPDSGRAIFRGVNQVADLIRPTYGPLPHTVVNDRGFLNKDPEILDSGGTIIRRIPKISDPTANLGVMLMREMLKTVQDKAGDGTALAAILCQKVFNEGFRAIAGGVNAMRLRSYLESGLKSIFNDLDRQTQSIEGEEALAALALSICDDPPMARVLGEIFDTIGEYGRLEVRTGSSRNLTHDYYEGMYWDDGLISREMATDPVKMLVELENPAILVSDLEVDQPDELVPFMDKVLRSGATSLLMITRGITGQALVVLNHPQNQARLRVAGIKTIDPIGLAPMQKVEDLALLTGGRPILVGSGDKLSAVKAEDLGHARRVWADKNNFGIIGGKGSPRELRAHINSLRQAYRQASIYDDRLEIQKRIGRLTCGSAALFVGAEARGQIDARKELAERTAEALHVAMIGGTIPGGGSALLACLPALQKWLKRAEEPEERAAARILISALQEPMQVIAASSGYQPGLAVELAQLAGEGHGFDARSQKIVSMRAEGILDPAVVIKTAVQAGISTAALALTTDTLVLANRRYDNTPS